MAAPGHFKSTPASGAQTPHKAVCEHISQGVDLSCDASEIAVTRREKNGNAQALAAAAQAEDGVIAPTARWTGYHEIVVISDLAKPS
ncbi:MAG: hypothetical protein MK209_00520 [Planctomycetes bacterium]|nr:hypothetical protein [Planctomycetota bacterium]